MPAPALVIDRDLPALPPSQESAEEIVDALWHELESAPAKGTGTFLQPQQSMTEEEWKQGVPYNREHAEALRSKFASMGTVGEGPTLKLDGSLRWMDIVHAVLEAYRAIKCDPSTASLDYARLARLVCFYETSHSGQDWRKAHDSNLEAISAACDFLPCVQLRCWFYQADILTDLMTSQVRNVVSEAADQMTAKASQVCPSIHTLNDPKLLVLEDVQAQVLQHPRRGEVTGLATELHEFRGRIAELMTHDAEACSKERTLKLADAVSLTKMTIAVRTAITTILDAQTCATEDARARVGAVKDKLEKKGILVPDYITKATHAILGVKPATLAA